MKIVSYSEKPLDAELEYRPDGVTAVFRENIQKQPADENGCVQYTAAVYEMPVSDAVTIGERFESQKEQWREKAVATDRLETEKRVREIRNKLLDETDREMSLDRIATGLPASMTSLKDVLQFLRNMFGALTGEMAKYRQALRDVPQQDGFPYNVEWPERP